jgi:SnoaL-like domain
MKIIPMSLYTLPALLSAFVLLFSSILALAEEAGPSRELIDETVSKMVALSQKGDMQGWASFFADDAIFNNSALAEAVVGREAIARMADGWSPVENQIEWRVIEGSRMVIGWRERAVLGDGKTSGWYSGVSTFVFDANGKVKHYEGVFNMPDIEEAYAIVVEEAPAENIASYEARQEADEASADEAKHPLDGGLNLEASDDSSPGQGALASLAAYLPDENNVAYQWYTPADELPRFQPYGLNYGIWQETEGDDGALEGHFSFKYTVYDCRRKRTPDANPISDLGCRKGAYLQPQVFLSYTGSFDFYMETRDSSPVINRMNNPALHIHTLINYKLENKDKISPNIRFFDIGLEHRSNGQDRDVEEQLGGRLLTEIAYEAGNDNFFDSISRSADYISFTAGSMNAVPNAYNYQVSAKAYLGHDSEVNWGDRADEELSILDYDIFRISLSRRFSETGLSWMPEVTLATEYTVGMEGFDRDSGEITLVAPVKLFDRAISLPLFAKAHFGPMNTLSNYTRSVSSFGVGLALWY